MSGRFISGASLRLSMNSAGLDEQVPLGVPTKPCPDSRSSKMADAPKFITAQH